MSHRKMLFIDDERLPAGDGWVIVRSSQAAIDYVVENGIPEMISFDHDLGGDDTSMKFVWWMVNSIMDNDNVLPENFAYTVHSQNPIGAANIRGVLDSFLLHIHRA